MTHENAARPSRRRRLPRALLSMGVLAGGLTAVVGLLHTSYGRPLMGCLGMSCPGGPASPAEVEALRLHGVGALRGTERARARPALGLTLDLSRATDVEDWAEARGLHCLERQAPSHSYACTDVPAAALAAGAGSWGDDGVIDELSFEFAPDGRLVEVTTYRGALTASDASRLFGEIAAALTDKLGTPGERAGEPTAAFLDGAPMNTTRLRYRFADYLATITAMNLSGRVALREQYQSAL